jgi:exonuclease III
MGRTFLCTGALGFDSSEILAGRPFGGCAIMWRSDFYANVEIIDINSRRLCAIHLVNDSLRLLLINVYIPYEGNDGMTEEFADQLHLIENIVLENMDCHIIIGGDFNVDLSRACVHRLAYTQLCWTAFVLIMMYFML